MDLVRCIIKPEFAEEGGKKIPITAIPVQLFDMHLGKFVEFNPDTECSKDYADALIKTNGRFEIIDAKAKVKKEDYVIRADYRKNEFENRFAELNPDERDLALSFIIQIIEDRTKPPATVKDGKTDNSVPDKKAN